ncbi:MAG TPA: response regulator [Rhizomicrobium sp.]|nr:response regulator [Rhizomicrobium sp.]
MSPGKSAKPRVLIVEDEIVVALFLEDVLDEFGYQVAGVVTQLDDAMARDQDYDIALLDVHINGRNVFDFADMLAVRGIPFVFATGYGERGIPERHRSSPVLQKPFQPDELKRILEDIGPAWSGDRGGKTISMA